MNPPRGVYLDDNGRSVTFEYGGKDIILMPCGANPSNEYPGEHEVAGLDIIVDGKVEFCLYGAQADGLKLLFGLLNPAEHDRLGDREPR